VALGEILSIHRRIPGQSLEDAIRIFEARAVYDGLQHKPFIRVGEHAGNLALCINSETSLLHSGF